MRKICFLTVMTLALAAPALQAQSPGHDALYQTVSGLDSEFFDSFNKCDEPGQLQKYASFLDPKLEFYHDNGGVSWTSKDYLDKTRQNVCGHFRRKLTPGSLEVYPIKGYGAIEEGRQEFCEINSEKCFGAAKFLIVWHQAPNGWQATRILSYGHHAI